jgi:hypothetical protein
MSTFKSLGLQGVQARAWTLASRFRIYATYECGDCFKVNLRERTFRLLYEDQALVASQCKWCGEINTFWDDERAIVFH